MIDEFYLLEKQFYLEDHDGDCGELAQLDVKEVFVSNP